jgi:hypothetical protein
MHVSKAKPPARWPGALTAVGGSSLRKSLFHCSGGAVLHVGQHVGVGVQGYGYGGVPEHLGNDFGIDILGQQQRGACVPKVVEAHPWLALVDEVAVGGYLVIGRDGNVVLRLGERRGGHGEDQCYRGQNRPAHRVTFRRATPGPLGGALAVQAPCLSHNTGGMEVPALGVGCSPGRTSPGCEAPQLRYLFSHGSGSGPSMEASQSTRRSAPSV